MKNIQIKTALRDLGLTAKEDRKKTVSLRRSLKENENHKRRDESRRMEQEYLMVEERGRVLVLNEEVLA